MQIPSIIIHWLVWNKAPHYMSAYGHGVINDVESDCNNVMTGTKWIVLITLPDG